jgi:RNA-dependent RNA polymerase
MHSEQAMMIMRTAIALPETNIEVILELERREIVVKFPFVMPSKSHQNPFEMKSFKFRIPLEKLKQIYIEKSSMAHRTLIIPLGFPPEFFLQTTDIEATHVAGERIWNEWQTWYRQTEIVEDRAVLEVAPIQQKRVRAIIDIGKYCKQLNCIKLALTGLLGCWTTYRLVFNSPEDEIARFDQMCEALVDYNIQIISNDMSLIQMLPRQDPEIWNFLDLPPHHEIRSRDQLCLSLLEKKVHSLSFGVRYQLEVCMSRDYINEHNITKEFLLKLASLDETKAIEILERVADLKTRVYKPMEIFKLRKLRASGSKKIPPYCTLTRAAIVTPTMVYYTTPAVEISNRVIRHWSHLSDRFIRVRFTDEINIGRINSRDHNTEDELFAKVSRAMKNGVMVGDRKYEFLAAGNSQFREHGAYFFAPTSDWPTDLIRQHLGDLELQDRQIPAKWCARLGQNFSTTRGISVPVHVKPTDTDVKRNGYTFTDGVGKISPELVRKISEELGYPREDPPSVFQFRLGGCKGVLAVTPELSGNVVHIRRSQSKFGAIHAGLEIIRASSFVTSVLNRQIILVLSTLGVSDEVFRSKMKNQLESLTKAMTDEKVALRELQKSIDVNQTTLTLAGLVVDGFMKSKDPFTVSMLRLWRSWSIKYLKEKAKIPIEQGAILLGCVDETATLRGHYENEQGQFATQIEKIANLPEVFCQVDRKRKGVYEPIVGLCILARNPSLHPGDIRVVRAVDNFRLRHMKNVVVLPQTGDRDLGNMCSGGDLDGDDYLVIWDQGLIPTEWNFPAMDFTAVPARKIEGREVTVDDMIDFHVTYMKNDRLPKIAHAHLAMADFQDLGVKDRKCKISMNILQTGPLINSNRY